MTQITLQPAVTLDIDIANLNIEYIRDNPQDKTIIVKIKEINRPFYLWRGDEYNSPEALSWNNDTALQKAIQIINNNQIDWAN